MLTHTPTLISSGAAMSISKRAPLPPGTQIEFCGDLAEVVHDAGGDLRLTVKHDGMLDKWYWSFEGEECRVVSLPKE